MREFFNGWTDEKINEWCYRHVFVKSVYYDEDHNGGYVRKYENGDTYELRYKAAPEYGYFGESSTITINNEPARTLITA